MLLESLTLFIHNVFRYLVDLYDIGNYSDEDDASSIGDVELGKFEPGDIEWTNVQTRDAWMEELDGKWVEDCKGLYCTKTEEFYDYRISTNKLPKVIEF